MWAHRFGLEQSAADAEDERRFDAAASLPAHPCRKAVCDPRQDQDSQSPRTDGRHYHDLSQLAAPDGVVAMLK
jgi:hypothetical protein